MSTDKPSAEKDAGWFRVRWNRFRGRHDDGTRHDWNYGSRGTGGWGVVRCLACGYEDIY